MTRGYAPLSWPGKGDGSGIMAPGACGGPRAYWPASFLDGGRTDLPMDAAQSKVVWSLQDLKPATFFSACRCRLNTGRADGEEDPTTGRRGAVTSGEATEIALAAPQSKA